MRKVCSDCLVDKDTSQFNKNANALDGLQNSCRECANAKRRVGPESACRYQYHYVCSTYEYPDAEDVNDDTITMEVHAVCESLDKSIEYMFELIQTLEANHETELGIQRSTTMVWDPVNSVLRMRYRTGSLKYIVTRIKVSDQL